MANMGYCRMQNTANDLEDCVEHWDDEMSDDELHARARILEMAQRLVSDYGIED